MNIVITEACANIKECTDPQPYIYIYAQSLKKTLIYMEILYKDSKSIIARVFKSLCVQLTIRLG